MRRQLSTIIAVVTTIVQANVQRVLLPLILAASLVAGGCVYRIDIQQGNLVDQELIEQVSVGMTRSQVRFLLGTPMVQDAFHEDRWDYMYYFRKGRARKVEKRWLIVSFEEDLVATVQRDVPVDDKP